MKDLIDLSEIGTIKGYKPVKKRKNGNDYAILAYRILVSLIILAGVVIVLWLSCLAYTPVATAKTIDLKDCRTNKECCEIFLEGASGYVREDAITVGCQKLLNI